MYDRPTLSNSQLEGEASICIFVAEPRLVPEAVSVRGSSRCLFDPFPPSPYTFQKWYFKTAA